MNLLKKIEQNFVLDKLGSQKRLDENSGKQEVIGNLGEQNGRQHELGKSPSRAV